MPVVEREAGVKIASVLFVAVVAAVIMAGTESASAACNGRMEWKTAANGSKVQVCVTGKYADCLNSPNLGYSDAQKVAYCNQKRAEARARKGLTSK
jgi:hypothetical protein